MWMICLHVNNCEVWMSRPKNLITENILLYIESIYYRLVEIAETRFGKAWQTIADGYWDQISQQAIKVHNLSAALRWD